ncbi:hypothetical protein B0H17DRAFT_1123799 [Mycena rosella]|uniref:Uncharacterized protein n=1 Tax=Mycena rosella TaxID=1033263 RepID=A0AAD7H2H8_MYCRO|nr:hypothetical protein B0H17DRAFT_1123799 [Mycena rosella]
MSTDSLNGLDSVNSVNSVPSDHYISTFQRAAAVDPAVQDAYVQINAAFSAPGKLREAPLIPLALATAKDLVLLLRGESRGVSKGYKDPKFDPFVKHRLKSMHIFLNQYTDPQSKTYGHLGASAQTAVGLAFDASYISAPITETVANPVGPSYCTNYAYFGWTLSER